MQGDAKKFYQIFWGSLPIKRYVYSAKRRGSHHSFDTLRATTITTVTFVFTNIFHLEKAIFRDFHFHSGLYVYEFFINKSQLRDFLTEQSEVEKLKCWSKGVD